MTGLRLEGIYTIQVGDKPWELRKLHLKFMAMVIRKIV